MVNEKPRIVPEQTPPISAPRKAGDVALFFPTWLTEARAFVDTNDPHDARRLANATRHLVEESVRLLALLEAETDIPDIH